MYKPSSSIPTNSFIGFGLAKFSGSSVCVHWLGSAKFGSVCVAWLGSAKSGQATHGVIGGSRKGVIVLKSQSGISGSSTLGL
jgi:hypothetical protein